jgi:hypothetical protein
MAGPRARKLLLIMTISPSNDASDILFTTSAGCVSPEREAKFYFVRLFFTWKTTPIVVLSRPSDIMSSIFGGARSGGAARKMPRHAQTNGSLNPASFIHGPTSALSSNIQGGSRMRESRTYGSVRGARSNMRPYRDP